MEIADKGWRKASRTSTELAAGLNIVEGRVTHTGVSEGWDLPFKKLSEVLGH